jgi:hypothetical protein
LESARFLESMGCEFEALRVKTGDSGVFVIIWIFDFFLAFLKKCQNRYSDDLKGLIAYVIMIFVVSYGCFWNQRDFWSRWGGKMRGYGWKLRL